MPFPSRGCRTCKQRRVKCDETRPVCNRCQKGGFECHIADDSRLVFLNENDYAIGRRKRPRGPNTRTAAVAITRETPKSISNSASPASTPKQSFNTPRTAESLSCLSTHLSSEIQPSTSISSPLTLPLTALALTYYSRHSIEQPPYLPEIATSHLSRIPIASCFTPPTSVLTLAIHAVAHATFGRAVRSCDALAVAQSTYAAALRTTNAALRDEGAAMGDEVLLAVMLLSFYENAVTGRAGGAGAATVCVSGTESGLRGIGAPSFAHHDGAMAMLCLRRQLVARGHESLELDKLVRRQLLRSLLLRSMPPPLWLRDGKEFGERGVALGLDRCMVLTAELRYRASGLFTASAGWDRAKLRMLLVRAQTLDDMLVLWANELPLQCLYSTRSVAKSESCETGSIVFDGTIHVYATVGHAGMWSQYRALRLTINDIMLRTLSFLAGFPDIDTEALEDAAKARVHRLADDLCASVPYILGSLSSHHIVGKEVANSTIAITKVPGPLKAVNGGSAFFLCWPLTMATMASSIPARHQQYLRDRLLDVSEIMDDGVLERVAAGFASPSLGGARSGSILPQA